jgi:flagellar protein FliO/FliZ
MQSLFDKLGSTATYVLGAIFFIVLLLVLLMVVRALLAGRVRAAGGRSRQPRLGVVDAFDLDRQRQLVLVRRDNVEHLIMIGGPNDVVVETAIVRAGELRADARPRVGEETPAAPAPVGAPVAAPAAPLAPAPVPPGVPPIGSAPAMPPAPPPLRSPTAAATPVTPPPPPPVGAPAGPRIAPPGGPSRLATAPPRPPGSPLPPPVRPIGTPMGPGVRSGMSPPAPAAAGAEGEASTPRRFEFGRTLSRANLEPAKPAGEAPATVPAPDVKPPEPSSEIDKIETKLDSSDAPQVPPPVPAPEQRPASDQPKQGDPLDALEEEMAKLLGRPPEKQ